MPRHAGYELTAGRLRPIADLTADAVGDSDTNHAPAGQGGFRRGPNSAIADDPFGGTGIAVPLVSPGGRP
jgi:hypothetical protein